MDVSFDSHSVPCCMTFISFLLAWQSAISYLFDWHSSPSFFNYNQPFHTFLYDIHLLPFCMTISQFIAICMTFISILCTWQSASSYLFDWHSSPSFFIYNQPVHSFVYDIYLHPFYMTICQFIPFCMTFISIIFVWQPSSFFSYDNHLVPFCITITQLLFYNMRMNKLVSSNVYDNRSV